MRKMLQKSHSTKAITILIKLFLGTSLTHTHTHIYKIGWKQYYTNLIKHFHITVIYIYFSYFTELANMIRKYFSVLKK